jgi:hypothetical protein
LWQTDRYLGYAAGVLILAAFSVVGIFQSLNKRPFSKYSLLVLAVPLAYWALRSSGVRLPYTIARGLEELALSMHVSQGSDGGKIVAAIVMIALALTIPSALVYLWGRQWKIPVGFLLLPVGGALLTILSLGKNLGNVVPAILLLLVSFAFGRAILRLIMKGEASGDSLEWIISVCIGSGVISLLGLGLGSTRLFNRAWLGLAFLFIIALSWRQVLELARGAITGLKKLGAPVDFRHEIAFTGIGALLSLVLLMSAMAALAPDLGFDSTTFHLAMANTFARQRSLEPSPMSHYYYEQIPVQTLYAWINVFSNLIAAKFLHFAYGVLMAFGVASLTRHFTGSAKAALLAVSLVSVSSLIWWLCGVGYVDLAVTFFFLATICALIRWVETDRSEWILVTGLCAGIAISAKLTNLVVILVIGLTILSRQAPSIRRIVISSSLCGVGLLLLWSPWLLRAYLLTGNPLFPYGNNIFRSPLVEPMAVFATIHFGFGTDLKALLSLPFTMTFFPEGFVEMGEFGPQLLALSPVLLLLLRRSWITKSHLVLLSAVAVFFLAWIFGLSQNLRYLTPALPLLAVLLGACFQQLTSLWKAEAFVSVAIVTALFLSALTNTIGSQSWWLRGDNGSGLPYRSALGRETNEDYLKTQVNAIDAIRRVNRVYGDKAQIWSIESGKRAYCESPIYFYRDVHTTLPMRLALGALDHLGEPQEISHQLNRLGFTHILLNGAIPQMSSPEEQRPLYLRAEFLDQFAVLEYADNGVLLYKLSTEPQSPPQVPIEKLQNGGFEGGADGDVAEWESTKPARVDRSGKEAFAGTTAVAVDGTSSMFSIPVPVEGGRTYRLRVYARAIEPKASGRFHLQFLSEQKQALPSAWLPFYPDTKYRVHEMLATAPFAARYARVILRGSTPEQWIWYDDASLAELKMSDVFNGVP